MMSKSRKLLLYAFIFVGVTSNIYDLYIRKAQGYNFLRYITITLFTVGFVFLILSDLMRIMFLLSKPSILIAATISTTLLNELIDGGADVNIHQGITGKTPLMFAVEAKKAENVKILIEAGADVNARNNLGGTALMEAVKGGLEDIAKILLEAGSDLNARDNVGATAVDIATRQSNVEMKKLLSKYKGIP